jgi:hypothetical protein
MEKVIKVIEFIKPDPKNKKKTINIKTVKLPTENGFLVFKELRGREPVTFKIPANRYQYLLDNGLAINLGNMSKEQVTTIFKVA